MEIKKEILNQKLTKNKFLLNLLKKLMLVNFLKSKTFCFGQNLGGASFRIKLKII